MYHWRLFPWSRSALKWGRSDREWWCSMMVFRRSLPTRMILSPSAALTHLPHPSCLVAASPQHPSAKTDHLGSASPSFHFDGSRGSMCEDHKRVWRNSFTQLKFPQNCEIRLWLYSKYICKYVNRPDRFHTVWRKYIWTHKYSVSHGDRISTSCGKHTIWPVLTIHILCGIHPLHAHHVSSSPQNMSVFVYVSKPSVCLPARLSFLHSCTLTITLILILNLSLNRHQDRGRTFIYLSQSLCLLKLKPTQK